MYKCGKLDVEDISQLKELCDWKHLKKRMNNSEAEVYVAYFRGEVIGELTVAYTSEMNDLRCIMNRRVYIEDFQVREDMQNKKCGTTLLHYVLNELYSRGFAEVTIGVEYNNDRALHLYDMFGFFQVLHTYHDYKLLLRE